MLKPLADDLSALEDSVRLPAMEYLFKHSCFIFSYYTGTIIHS